MSRTFVADPSFSQSLTSEDDPELPTYSARSRVQYTEQIFQLEDKKSRAWLWLKVNSRSKANQLPLFYDHDTLSGKVEIDFERVDGAKAVSVSVSTSALSSSLISLDSFQVFMAFQVFAGVTAVGQDEIRFLEISKELWNLKSSPQLKGKHSYPYAISLPSDVPVTERGKKPTRTFPLPPSFSERASPAYIDYKLVVTVKKSSFRVNQVYVHMLLNLHERLPKMRDPPSDWLRPSYTCRSSEPILHPLCGNSPTEKALP